MLNTVIGSFSSGVVAATSSYESIASSTPTSGSSITFNSIPSGYASLQIRGIMFGSSAYNVSVQLNSDSSANYSIHRLSGNGSTVTAAGQDSSITYGLYGSPNNVDGTTTQGTGFIIDIHDYTSTTKNKTSRTFTGIDKNGTGEIALWSGCWYSTAAVTSATVYLLGGTFATGTTISLYGIKGA